MKTLYPFKKNLFVIAVILVAAVQSAFSQTIPELVFRNPELVSGLANQNGAQYRFSNVGGGLDAEVKILNRSANNVKVSTVDSIGIGWDKALQPIVGIEGTVGANQNWWVRFSLTFFEAGTNNKRKIDRFFATGLDIDGDNVSIREWVQMDKVSTVNLSPVTSLGTNLLNTTTGFTDYNNNGSDYKIMGPVANFTNIDTAATSVMAMYQYDNKDNIEFVLGGTTGNATSTAGMRMSSVWFRQFNLTPLTTLPVNLLEFSANHTNNMVAVNWKTADEINFSHYVLQRSYDAREYADVVTFFADDLTSGTKNYNYNDRQVITGKGIAYYRLVMVNKDGSEKVSEVKVVRFGKMNAALTLSVFPNPASADIKVTMAASLQYKTGRISIVNAGGQVVKSFTIAKMSQTEMISLAGLSAGVYSLRIEHEGETAIARFVKK